MGQSSALRVQDMHAIIALVNDCRDLGDDFAAWAGHFATGMARLTGADFGITGVLDSSPKGVTHRAGAAWGWENGFDLRVWQQVMDACGGRLEVSPFLAAYFGRAEGADGAGLTRRDLVADRVWHASTHFREAHEPMGFGHTLASFLVLPGVRRQYNGTVTARHRSERRDFSQRERKLVAEAQAMVLALLGGPLAGCDEPSPTHLPSRTRQVLRCLLEGDGDKQIAARLKMSRHTANDHTKDIFAHFGVCSRAELLARWIRRGWGRRLGWSEA
jgi:DNA-binding CsgD family transcriptional regulator